MSVTPEDHVETVLMDAKEAFAAGRVSQGVDGLLHAITLLKGGKEIERDTLIRQQRRIRLVVGGGE